MFGLHPLSLNSQIPMLCSTLFKPNQELSIFFSHFQINEWMAGGGTRSPCIRKETSTKLTWILRAKATLSEKAHPHSHAHKCYFVPYNKEVKWTFDFPANANIHWPTLHKERSKHMQWAGFHYFEKFRLGRPEFILLPVYTEGHVCLK